MASAEEIKAKLNGNWVDAITALCMIDPGVLDGAHHPCPKCGGEDRFNIDRNGGGGVFCNQCQPGTGSGIDTIMWLNGWDYPRAKQELADYLNPPIVVSDDVRKLRHATYTKLASVFGIDAKHQADLGKRGLSELEIQHRGYWTAPGQAHIKLMENFDSLGRVEISKSVPGVMPGGSLTLAARDALMIPVRNTDGEIVGIQYRPDNRGPKGPKYLWLSSKDSGVSPGAPCHFALTPADAECKPGIIRLTEGPLKADIATSLSGIKTLAIAGVNNWKVGAAAVQSLNPSQVWLAFDSDSSTNIAVARAVVDVFDALNVAGLQVHFESWSDDHKGIDDALAAGAEVSVQTLAATKATIERLRKVASQKPEGDRLRNYKLVPSASDNPNKAWDKKPLPFEQIAQQLTKIGDGWPKASKGQLFIKTDKDEIRFLSSVNQLFGWVSTKCPAEFAAGEGMISKHEFYEEIPNHVEQFEGIEELPHFPPIRGNYYAKRFEPGDGKALQGFVDFFSPATLYDRQLIIAFIVTTFWGGSPGRRVAFGIDSITGTGAGKSELAKRVSSLSGGLYDLDASKLDEEMIRKQLMNGEQHRVALLDNVKKSCLSSATIESMITSAVVGGHRLRVGYGSRKNVLTWVITMNGMKLSRDLAQRTIIIKLTEPVRSGTWDDDVDKYLEDHRADIIADIAAYFQEPEKPLARFTRWASWERAVLSRLENPEHLQTLIDTRANEADEDRNTSVSIKEYFEEQLRNFGLNPDEEVIHIPSPLATEWLVDATGQEFSKRSAAASIKNLVDGGSLRNLSPNASRKHGRGWLWNSGHPIDQVNYELVEFVNRRKTTDDTF